jgi:hypothetical protein
LDVEQPIMMRARSKRQRSLGFEALEGRLALSTSMGTALASHHADAMLKSQISKTISASFKGHVQVSGSNLTVTNLTGVIGTDRFSNGRATGTMSGKQFDGGDVYLNNSKGSIHLTLGAAYSVKKGKKTLQYVPVSVDPAGTSGKYAAYAGITGTMTSWNVPAKPNAAASFGGSFIA